MINKQKNRLKQWFTVISLSAVMMMPVVSSVSAEAAGTNATPAFYSATAASKAQAILLDVDEKNITLSSPIVKENGVTYVALKDLAKSLKFTYTVEDMTKTVIMRKDNLTISMKIGDQSILINGKKKKIAGSVSYKNKVLYAPVRPIAEQFYAEVKWNAKKNAVQIISLDYSLDQNFKEWLEYEDNRPVMTAKQIAEKYDESVVMIMTNNSQGSGVVIGDDLILTNRHVIKDSTLAAVYDIYGQEYTVKGVVASDEGSDLAILLTERKMKLDQAVLAAGFNLQKGSKVYAIGSPLGVQNTISEGLISNIIYDGQVRTLQTSTPIDHGSSGGALFNEYGEVVGITTSGYPNTQADLNFAVSAYHALHLKLGISDESKEKAKFLPRSLPDTLKGQPDHIIEDMLRSHFGKIATSYGEAKLSNWKASRDQDGWVLLTADIDPLFYLYNGKGAEQEMKLWAIQLGHEMHRMLPNDTVQVVLSFERIYNFKPRGLKESELTQLSEGKWKVRYPVLDMQLKDQLYIVTR